MGKCCGSGGVAFDGVSVDYKRRLWLVIVLNASMFFIEIVAGNVAKSQALQADALDFFGDTITYGLSLAVIGSSLKVRSIAALLKGISLFIMGIWVLGSTIYSTIFLELPQAKVMGIVGFFALLTNFVCVLLLIRYKDGDANVRSVWLCSRNDMLGNIAVMFAAFGVWGTTTGWPDIVVAGIMASLFLFSAFQITSQAMREYHTKENH